MFDNHKRPNELERRQLCSLRGILRPLIPAFLMAISLLVPSPCCAATGSANEIESTLQFVSKDGGTDHQKVDSQIGRFDPLDDAPESFVPQTTRSWDEEALLESLAHYTTGRSAERREAYLVALQHYQRAFLFNPNSKDAARAAVAVAFKLKRNHEALRWAVQAALIDRETNSNLLKHLAVFLIETHKYQQAADFYRRAFDEIPETQLLVPDDINLLLDAARLYLIDDEKEKSAYCFARALDMLENPERIDGFTDETEKEELFKDPALSIRLMTEAFIETDRSADAVRALKKLKPLIDDSTFIAYIQAKIEKSQGKKRLALRHITNAVSQPSAMLDEEAIAPYKLYADLLEANGNGNSILSKLQALFKKNPDNGPVGHALAQQFFDEGKLEDAASLYRRLIRDAPSATAYKRLVTIYIKNRSPQLLDVLGEIVEKTGSLQVIESDVESIASDAALLKLLTEAYCKSTADHKPSDIGPSVALGLLLLQAEKIDEAAEMFEAAVHLTPEKATTVYRLWGGTLLLAEHSSEAADVFRREVEAIDEDDDQKAAALYILTTALAMADKYDEALKTAHQTAKLDPEDIELRARIAWVLMLADRNAEAIETFEKIIEQLDAKTDIESRTILRSVRLTLARLFAKVGDDQASQDIMLQILDEFPEDIEVSNDLGYYWADENRYLTVSLRLIDRAVKAEPENAAYRDSLGWVYYRLGRFDEARVELERSAELAEKENRLSGEIFEHLGDVNAALDRMTKARDYWQKAEASYIEEKSPEEAARAAKKRSEAVTDSTPESTTNNNVPIQQLDGNT